MSFQVWVLIWGVCMIVAGVAVIHAGTLRRREQEDEREAIRRAGILSSTDSGRRYTPVGPKAWPEKPSPEDLRRAETILGPDFIAFAIGTSSVIPLLDLDKFESGPDCGTQDSPMQDSSDTTACGISSADSSSGANLD